jgi:large subunit ribosomal protein L5
MNDLKKKYQTEVAPKLLEEFSLGNVMAVPKLDRVVVNIGLKEAVHDKGVLTKATEQLTAITGQKPKVTRARISIANFKVRQGDPVGLTVTLRGKRMYDFVGKLFAIVLPRLRDFQGVSGKAFDVQGNYTLGMSEQIVFAEVDYSKVDKVRGLEITFVIKRGNATISKRLLELLGMPFEKGTK